MPMYDNYFKTKQFKRKMRKSTLVWSFQIKWKNVSTEWVALKYFRETNPVDVSEYATDRGI